MLSHDSLPIQNELSANEKLLWSGRPPQGLLFRAVDIALIPFTLMWAGFALFWESMAIASGFFLFILWGIPFVLVGAFMVFGRFLVDAYLRNKTFYGLTDQRAIIISGLLQKEIKSLNLRTTSDITLNQKSDGTGSIVFGTLPPMAWMMRGTSINGMGRNMVPQFELIPDAKRVYELIRTVQG